MRREPPAAAVLSLACLLWCGPVAAQAPDPPSAPAPEPPRSQPGTVDYQERTTVVLAEVRILVTDRQGRAITDLRPDEIRVFEADAEQRLAFLESASGSRERPAGASPYVLPAKAVRRIVLAFDVRNSRKTAREPWRAAARSWLATGMQSGDRVGIVLLGDYPRWIAELTDDRDALLAAVDGVSLKRAAPDRNNGHVMSRLMTEMRTCFERTGEFEGSAGPAVCAYNAARPYVHRWNAEAAETVQNLQALVGQLAAVPGRKAVLLFSDGLIEDAAMLAVDAMITHLGSAEHDLDVYKMKRRLGKDVQAPLAELKRVARAGGVSLFVLDTGSRAESGSSGQLEHTTTLPASAFALDPWRELGDASGHTLDLLARETGGRAYHGQQELADSLRAAADAFLGMYTVGYYRADTEEEPGPVRVAIDRRQLDVSYPERAEVRGHRAEPQRVVLVIGKPHSQEGSDAQVLPVAAKLAFDVLPLREGRGGVGTVLGICFQAIAPDGTVVEERLVVETVGVDTARRAEASGKQVVHWEELPLAPGTYRIRARVSDDRQLLIAERAVDLTVDADGVRPVAAVGG